jgi:hypothetical protein
MACDIAQAKCNRHTGHVVINSTDNYSIVILAVHYLRSINYQQRVGENLKDKLGNFYLNM